MSHKLPLCAVLGIGAIVGLAAAGTFTSLRDATAAPQAKDNRDDDRAAIRKALQAFVAALERGDAAAVAAHWTTEGEYAGQDGSPLRGRAAIARAYTDYFARNPKPKVEIESESLRFPSRDTAIAEGYFRAMRDQEEAAQSRYHVHLVREDGKWLMAELRESAVPAASLHDLSWLIGTWEAKGDDIEVRTTYEWWENKAFIRARFTIREKGQTLTGFQMIGQDRATGQVRSWTFEGEGGFGEAVWARDGKKWLLDAAGVQSDGSTLSATNILIPVDQDTFTWQPTHRTLDGEELPDLRPVRVTRSRAP